MIAKASGRTTKAPPWPRCKSRHRAFDIGIAVDRDCPGLHGQFEPGGLERLQEIGGKRCGRRIVEHCHAPDRGRGLLDELHPFAAQRRFDVDVSKAGDIAAGARQLLDEAAADRIGNYCEHDRDRARLLEESGDSGGGDRKDHVGPPFDQLLGEPSQPGGVVRGPTVVDLDIAALSPARLVEPLAKCPNPALRQAVVFAERRQNGDPPHLVGRLRTGQNRRQCRAGTEREEISPPHSMTSSARARRVGGIVRPSALAVLRLMVRSNLRGGSTDRSAGFAPLRILSTKPAARPNRSR